MCGLSKLHQNRYFVFSLWNNFFIVFLQRIGRHTRNAVFYIQNFNFVAVVVSETNGVCFGGRVASHSSSVLAQVAVLPIKAIIVEVMQSHVLINNSSFLV